MLVENTKENRNVQRAVATMAVEGMYFDESFIQEIIKVSNGEKTSEELRQEIIRKHAGVKCPDQ